MPTNVDPRAGKLLPARSLIDPLALAIGGLIGASVVANSGV